MSVNHEWQFSLRSFALAILVVALILGHAYTSRRLWLAEAELKKLRRQHGYLEVSDPSEVRLIRVVHHIEPYTWKWQLYLPPGREYRLQYATRGIPKEGLPISTYVPAMNIRGDKAPKAVRVTLHKDPLGRWTTICSFGSQGFICAIDAQDNGWLETGELPPLSRGTAAGQFPADKPFELLRIRQSSSIRSPQFRDPPQLDEGLLIWLEPI